MDARPQLLDLPGRPRIRQYRGRLPALQRAVADRTFGRRFQQLAGEILQRHLGLLARVVYGNRGRQRRTGLLRGDLAQEQSDRRQRAAQRRLPLRQGLVAPRRSRLEPQPAHGFLPRRLADGTGRRELAEFRQYERSHSDLRLALPAPPSDRSLRTSRSGLARRHLPDPLGPQRLVVHASYRQQLVLLLGRQCLGGPHRPVSFDAQRRFEFPQTPRRLRKNR